MSMFKFKERTLALFNEGLQTKTGWGRSEASQLLEKVMLQAALEIADETNEAMRAMGSGLCSRDDSAFREFTLLRKDANGAYVKLTPLVEKEPKMSKSTTQYELTIKLTVPTATVGTEHSEIERFEKSVLGSSLVLHSNEIGGTLGEVEVTRIGAREEMFPVKFVPLPAYATLREVTARCWKCAFDLYLHKCDSAPCSEDEREDKQTGYYVRDES